MAIGRTNAAGMSTSDATATADKIRSGYTAYARGEKLTGTYSGYKVAVGNVATNSARTLTISGLGFTPVGAVLISTAPNMESSAVGEVFVAEPLTPLWTKNSIDIHAVPQAEYCTATATGGQITLQTRAQFTHSSGDDRYTYFRYGYNYVVWGN